jgi:hypothetical protein
MFLTRSITMAEVGFDLIGMDMNALSWFWTDMTGL